MGKIPKFLYAKESERHFVIHTQFPKFIGEFIKQPDGSYTMEPELIDNPSVKSGDEKTFAKLMREAGDFISQKLKS